MRLSHVDGLRAVAVIAVLLFHLGFTKFSGGFVGVDVFFVISGFVISRMILRDLETDRFLFSEFYIRRFKRLYPALIITITICIISGILLLPPNLLVDLSRSSLASISAWSNLYFWLASGYFDKAAELKPLLHTWTLSLEWQFYAVWPVILWMTPRKLRLPTIVVLSIVSVIFSIIWWLDPTTPFYWMPFRIFEFGLGALILWMPKARGFLAEIASILGLGMITLAVFTFGEQTPFPSYYALLPAVGTAIVIWAGMTKIGQILGTAPMTFLGRCSYSVYLVHWPLIAFTVSYTAQPLTMSGSVIIGLASVLIGAAIYRWVEEPFWHGRLAHRALKLSVPWLIATAILCAYANTGLWWRLPPGLGADVPNAAEFHISHFGGAGYEPNKIVRIGDQTAKVSFHIMGDSFALQLLSGLDDELQSRNLAATALADNGCPMLAGVVRIRDGVPDSQCIKSTKSAIEAFNDGLPVLLAVNWNSYQRSIARKAPGDLSFSSRGEFYQLLSNEIRANASLMNTRRLVVAGPFPSAGSSALSPYECLTAPDYFGKPCVAQLERSQSTPALLVAFKSLSNHENIDVIDPFSYLCRDGSCQTIRNGQLIYSDAAHLSKYGSQMIASQLVDDMLASSIDISD